MFPTARIPAHLYLLLTAMLVVLVGCPPTDLDEDGYTAGDDCDDDNAAVNPGAAEVCDGADNDCDGTIDEADATDATTWYADVDGDGYGDAEESVVACEQPSGRVLSSTDCDDLEATANPAEVEATCDGVDNDCDPTTLDEPDGDGDGSSLCVDCDDDDADIGPQETETTCNGVDDDCDATTLDEPDGDGDGSTVCDDCDDTDAAINPNELETTCNGVNDDCDDATLDEPDEDADSYSVCVDCDDSDAAINPGAAEVTCDLIDNDCDAATLDGPDDDSDGHTVCLDCDDSDATVYPGAYDACDGVDTDCNGTPDDGDTDADGYLACADCDDNNAAINPGVAYDACDTVDDDCSGTADDGDADGDGSTACDDCDDSDAAINPGATELCDGVNNDCDADTDEPDAADALTWYLDDDGDGQGDDATFEVACNQPVDHVLSDEDCDDTDASIFLGAEEICAGGDENCNGFIDDGCTTVEHCGYITADETWGPMEVHHVTCNVSVEGSAAPTLTIEDWTTVTFAPGTGMYVGNYNSGELQVTGTGWVTFTADDDVSPQAGDWTGLYFGSVDTGSRIAGATIEYGGGSGNSNLRMYYADVDVIDVISRESSAHGLHADGDSEVLIQGSSFLDNNLDGVHLAGSAELGRAADPTFVDNTLSGNGNYAMTLPANYVGELDASSTFAGNTDPAIRISGYVTQDAEWQALDAPLLVTSNVSIEGAAAPEVTIEDGATVAFESNTGLYVGNYNSGALFTAGDAVGVTFTSWDSSPNPGDWIGLYLGSSDTGSELYGLNVSYGGSTGYGNIHAYYADVVVSGCTSTLSGAHGLYGQGDSELQIDGSTFSDNNLDGVHLASGTALEQSSSATFTDNVLTGNGGYSMTIPANSAGQLDATSTFTGNDDDAVRISGYVTDDQTWQAIGVPLLVTANVSIEGAASPEVTVEDGASMAFEANTGLYVGNYNSGALFVDGTSTGVLFTSWDDTPNEGDWTGVYFGSSDTGSELYGLDVMYGGGTNYGNIHSYYADLVLSGCSSSDSSSHGLYAQGDSMLEISDSTFAYNNLDGVHLASGTGLEETASASFAGNTLTGNGSFPMTIPANSGGMVDATSTFVGNDEDAVRVSGYVTDDGTWQAIDVPWLVFGNVSVEGAASPELTIDDGATVMFEDGIGLYVGNYNSGALFVDGFASRVTFTAWDDTPNPGDWLGVYFGSSDTGSDLLGLDISYGGGNGYGNLYFYYADGAVTDSTVSWSSSWGIYRNNGNPTLTNIVYSDNDSGDLY